MFWAALQVTSKALTTLIFQCHWLDIGLLWQTSNKVECNRLCLIKLETAPEMTWHNVQLMSQKKLAMLEGAMHNLNNI